VSEHRPASHTEHMLETGFAIAQDPTQRYSSNIILLPCGPYLKTIRL